MRACAGRWRGRSAPWPGSHDAWNFWRTSAKSNHECQIQCCACCFHEFAEPSADLGLNEEVDEELDDELREHLTLLQEGFERRGMDPTEAFYAHAASLAV